MLIGVGLIIDDEAFNTIREIELKLSNKSKNYHGLFQPPHITIKRPFEASDKTLEKLKKILKEYARNQKPINVELKLFKNFGKSVIYSYCENNQIHKMHNALLEFLKTINVDAGEFDGDKFVGHCTLAMNLKETDFKNLRKDLNSIKGLTIKTEIKKLGIFLNIDKNHWIIIATEDL